MGCHSSKSIQTKEGNSQVKTSQSKKCNLKKAGAEAEDIRDKYHIEAILGSGSFGQVRQARLKNNLSEVRAVKMVERDVPSYVSDDDDFEHAQRWSAQAVFSREVEMLQQMNHPNVIRYFDFYEDPHFLYVVMELCSGGEVFQKILELKRFLECDAVSIGRQMVSAIDYIHQLGICHRDIKAENFMFAGNVVKLIDFGMATRFEPNQVLTELCGSPHYLSPELIGQKYNQSVDLWALGVLLYLLMYGRYPYDGKTPDDVMSNVLTEPIKWRHDKAKLSANAIDLLKKLLERNPEMRISAEETLQHVWFQPREPGENDIATASIPTDVIRRAHRRSSENRKTMDKNVEELRSLKLKQIDDAFSKGIRSGTRIGPTPKDEAFLQMPEFVRRDNKLTTAPSWQHDSRDNYMEKMISSGDEDQKIGKDVTHLISKLSSDGASTCTGGIRSSTEVASIGLGRLGQRAASAA